MKVMFNGREIGSIITNRSMTIEEVIYALGYDVRDAEDCEKAYNDGFDPAYLDECGNYLIDTDSCEMVY